MNEKEITLPQFLQAQQYVRSYIKMNGGDPLKDEEIKSWWPEDVKKAAETRDTFLRDMEESNMIP